jgi:hypothetical protein
MDSDRTGVNQRGCIAEARVHGREPGSVIRQLAVEVRALGCVVSDSACCAETTERPGDSIVREAGLGSQTGDVDSRLEGQERGDDVGIVRGLLACEIPEHATLSGESSARLGAESEDESRVVELKLPEAGGSAWIVRGGIGAERAREAKQRFERLEPVQP